MNYLKLLKDAGKIEDAKILHKQVSNRESFLGIQHKVTERNIQIVSRALNEESISQIAKDFGLSWSPVNNIVNLFAREYYYILIYNNNSRKFDSTSVRSMGLPLSVVNSLVKAGLNTKEDVKQYWNIHHSFDELTNIGTKMTELILQKV